MYMKCTCSCLSSINAEQILELDSWDWVYNLGQTHGNILNVWVSGYWVI